MAKGNYRPLDGLDRTVNMPVRTAAVLAGNAVEKGTDGVVALTDGGTMFGIAMSAGAVGEEVAIWRGPGRMECKAATGFNPDRGDLLYAAASDEVDGGSSGNRSLGVVVDSDPASGGTIVADFDPWGSQVNGQILP